MKAYKVAAYITSYNDLNSVERCIAAIKQQTYLVEDIYIIDNSKEKLKFSFFETDGVIVDTRPDNIGIASGMAVGIKWAINQEYDLLWTFDQDSEPLPDSLEKLVDCYHELVENNKQIGIIAPLSIDVDSELELVGAIFDKYRFIGADSIFKPREFYTKKSYECDIVITSGSLVSLQAAKDVDLPNEGLFIDAVDWDYCMKFRKKGYSVVVVTDAVMNHTFGTYLKRRKISNYLSVPMYTYSPLRYYYMCRNHTFIEGYLAKSSGYYFLSVAYRFKSLMNKIAKILVYESDQKILKIWACLRGTFDGFMDKLGKNWSRAPRTTDLLKE
jgi:rhamnosyltransferase